MGATTCQNVVLLGAAHSSCRSTIHSRGAGVNLAVSFGPNATPRYCVDTMAAKRIVSHTLLPASMHLDTLSSPLAVRGEA